jgi:hypothetical protein
VDRSAHFDDMRAQRGAGIVWSRLSQDRDFRRGSLADAMAGADEPTGQ